MTDRQHFRVLTVPNTQLEWWYGAGWSYDAPADRPGYSIISWPHDRAAVAPLAVFDLDDEQVHLARATSWRDERVSA